MRDLYGAERAHRAATRILSRRLEVKMTAKLLDQLARIGRDSGRIHEALPLANKAMVALGAESKGFRAWRTRGEVLYTIGSIKRLAGDCPGAIAALKESVRVRTANRDAQGAAYCLIELAICAVTSMDSSEARNLLARAEHLSVDPEVVDRRALAYSSLVRSIVELLDGNEAAARQWLAEGTKWTATHEQGIRGNPGVLQGVIEVRFGRLDVGTELLRRGLRAEDRAIRATAARLLADIERTHLDKRASLLKYARMLASRFGFSLNGIGAEALARGMNRN